jgi:hypothetical protein
MYTYSQREGGRGGELVRVAKFTKLVENANMTDNCISSLL